MTIKHLGQFGDKMQEYIAGKSDISGIFTGGIFYGKVKKEKDDPYLYFMIETNNINVENERSDLNGSEKVAAINMFLIFPSKQTPDVDIYNAVCKISNNICEQGQVTLTNTDNGSLIITGILEGNQSGVVQTEKDIPVLMAQYLVYYKAKY